MQTGLRLFSLLCLGMLLSSPAEASLRDLLSGEGFTEAEVVRAAHTNAAFIKVEINGHPLTLCIDTGSPMTILTREAALRANVPTNRLFGPISGINGLADPKAAIASLRSFKIAGSELASEPILISDAPFPLKMSPVKFDGLLGWKTMKKNRVIFGYAPALFFFRPDGKSARRLDAACRAEQFLSVKLRPYREGYYLPLTLDGQAARMLLDSGAAFTLVSDDFARLHLDAGKTVGTGRSLGIDGNPVLQQRVTPKTMELGSRAFAPITITSGAAKLFENKPDADGRRGKQIDGLLGYDLVGRFYSLLDMGNDRLYLHPRPEKEE
ncbi:Aspartyl protease [Verrucomicrobium sp. GAS474]|uniref:retropepsin-like aspartic protease n=1 Tax=Verrucomicrobium sp. GAS474 TaxID=1882831 RepID=UPI00087CECEE|nr:retropepsin-like aspartic protease [Verrucomicrobium sp. GAS474]SDT88039.1 Aspartyl protease [Verrucomicrobium sp. GAS474]